MAARPPAAAATDKELPLPPPSLLPGSMASFLSYPRNCKERKEQWRGRERERGREKDGETSKQR